MDTNLEIIIQPSSNLSHEQTTVGGASSVPQDESRGLNEMTPEDLNSLKKQVYEYADEDRWKEAEPIFNDYAEMVRIPLTDNKDRALHVAVKANSITFVKGLVNLMTPQDLEIQNRRGYTAFRMAAESGNSDLVQIMIEKNQNLPLIKSEGYLPVHLAAICGHPKIVEDLSSKTLLQKMDSEDIQKLFFQTIESDMFDVATKLFEEDGGRLALATWGDEEKQTALEMLLRKPSEELSTEEGNDRGASSGECLLLLQKVWLQLRTQLEWKKILELKGSRSSVLVDALESGNVEGTKEGNNRGASSGESLQLLQKLCLQLRTQLNPEEILEFIGPRSTWLAKAMVDALESGNVEALKWLLREDPKLWELPVNSNKQNILHYAVRKRHSSFLNYIFKMPQSYNYLLQLVDGGSNNILHLAAHRFEKEETSSRLTATYRMGKAVARFKEIEEKIKEKALPKLRTMRNREGKIPMDVFHDEHNELSKEINDTAKGIADSGMLVAALVATVAFAAALVVPGDKTSPSFTVFILANAAALFTSSASILSFLSNFTTSRFANSEFVIALHPSLILGIILLLISIGAMVLSFAAASFLIFEHTSKWVAYLVTSMGVFPILLFLLFQSSMFDTRLWSRFYHLSDAQ